MFSLSPLDLRNQTSRVLRGGIAEHAGYPDNESCLAFPPRMVSGVNININWALLNYIIQRKNVADIHRNMAMIHYVFVSTSGHESRKISIAYRIMMSS